MDVGCARLRPMNWPKSRGGRARYAGWHLWCDGRGITSGRGCCKCDYGTSLHPLKKLLWRNADLKLGTIDALIDSLEVSPTQENLVKAREADDLMVLKTLSQNADITTRAKNGPGVSLLWDVCRIPDFRGISHAEHASLLEVIFRYLFDLGRVPDDWFARQIKRIDRTEGDIDTLSKRLSFVRTWTYVAQRSGWLDDENHWRGATAR